MLSFAANVNMRRAFLTYILWVAVALAHAQDLKVDFTKLTFDSEFEKSALEAFQAKTPDYFALLLAPDTSVTAEQYTQWKSNFLKQLDAFKVELATAKKKNDKQTKFLYDKIHGKFLTKYEATNLFSQVFKDGIYNCVSATGLYSLAFDHYGIPYSIQEKPTHVYVIAYPETEQIKIETTTPIGGYMEFNQAFKQNYVKKLSDYKVISAAEYQTTPLNELFDKHFFNSESIDITKLIGVQYVNSGLFYSEKNELEKACNQFEKSYLFYPSEKSRFLIYSTLGSIFQALNYTDVKKAIYLAKLSQFTKEGVTSDMIAGEFYKINQKVYLQDGDQEKYNKMYTILQESIEDDEIKKQISYIYNYENGRIRYNKKKHEEAMPFLEKALTAKPNHADLSDLFLANVEQLGQPNNDKVAVLKQLQYYSETYPALNNHSGFTFLLAKNMLYLFTTNYQKGKIKEGESYRIMFEDLLTKSPDFNKTNIDYFIGEAYSAACVYYFKLNQKSKARTFVDKGLSYVPNNFQLRSRKQLLSQ